MTPNITPTQGFILVQHISREGQRTLFLPDGQRDPEGDIIVLAVGPDVPGNPPITPGDKILLRGDAKVFGVDAQAQTAMLDYRSIMGVFAPEPVDNTEPLPFTDEEIRELVRPPSNGSTPDLEELRHG